MKLDKETQEGMKNLDVTASVSDLLTNASSKQDAEFSEEQQEVNLESSNES